MINLLFWRVVQAADINVPIETSGPLAGGKVSPYPDVGRLVANLYTTIIIVSGIYTFINLALAGFQYISSSGDKVGLEAARQKITHSFLGLAIVVGAYAFGFILQNVFGVSFLGGVLYPKP